MPDEARKSVLMIDDNKEHVLLCLGHLPPSEFKVDSAETGTMGLMMAESGRYDIIVIDQSLPDMTGLDVLKKLKGKGYGGPIVFVSASDDPGLSVKALKAGACDFIVKTFQYYAGLRERLLENMDACPVPS
jgi:DNA-binding response OmpR family regulator